MERTEVIHQDSCIIDSVLFAGEVSNFPFEVSNFVLQLGQPRLSGNFTPYVYHVLSHGDYSFI
uniref:Uncharacterized protein n=1 Tax=Triticum urartu TaxID=4572 RepID=A0A8R7TNH9_TRIUA